MQKIKILNFIKRGLIISELQKLSYSFTFCQVFISLFLLVVCACSLYSCTNSKSTKQIEAAEDLLWSKPDSCLAFLEGIDYSSMNEHDSLVCALMREHAIFKIEYGLEDDSMLHALKDYFEAQGDHRYAGEACYIIGRNLVLRQNLPMATFYQKAAEEHLLKAKDVPSQLLGMVYYGLGCSAEYERLFEIANEYYVKALPYFIESRDSLYTSCTYRDIAKSGANSIDDALQILDTALNYLPSNVWEGYRLDIQAMIFDNIIKKDSTEYLQIYHILCDSLQHYRYATDLCNYYLTEKKLNCVPYYLSLAELDTANSVWSKEHYLFNKAWYNYEIGQKDSAYFILRDLHLWQTEEIESSSYTRSYMVEQRYDAERERADRLLAEAGKRRAYLTILIIAVSALLLTAVLLLMLQQERMKQQQKIEQLRHKQQLLKEHLKTRLSISEELKRHRTSGKEISEDTYNEILSSVVYVRPGHWEQLVADFDVAYAGLLSDLSSRYPALTETDLLYIVMIVLDCNTAEISKIMNINQQSVSNQKQRLKQHLNADGNIDDWLRTKADVHLKEAQKFMHLR